MPLYSYTAMDMAKNQISGEMDTLDKSALEASLNEKGYILISCNKKSSIGTSIVRKKVRKKDIIIFSRQFSVMVSAGITIQEAIRLLSEGTENKTMREELREIRDDMKAGLSLSEAMIRRGDVFDEFFIGMVKVGEYSGAFDDIMKRAADFYEQDGKMRRSIRGAMVYPMVLTVMSVAVVIYMLVGIIPQFEAMFEQLGSGNLPGITKFFTALSAFLIDNALVLIAVALLSIGSLVLYLKSEKGTANFHRLLLRIPVVQVVVIKTTTSRFARCMDILMKSGVTLVQSFELVDSMISNVVVRDRFRICKDSIIAGYSYSVSLEKMEIFPKMLISMVMVGETTGSLSEVFDKTSTFFDDEANEAMKGLVQLIEPILLIFIGIALGAIILAIMLPMFELMNQIA